MPTDRPPLCSEMGRNLVQGTAKKGIVTLALEHLGGWGRDILDGDALGEELTPAIRSFLKRNGAQLQLIRKPGRGGQHRKKRYLYIATSARPSHCQGSEEPFIPILERIEVTGPEDILTLDLSTPGSTPGAIRVDHPIMLVCTHGKRDRCCALRGRPIATAMQTCFYGDEVWESSHTKGHRFAPSMILLPYNYSYGYMSADDAIEAVKAARRGELYLPGNRGRGTLDSNSQVAELAVASLLESEGQKVAISSLHVETVEDNCRRVTDPISGRVFEVEGENRSLGKVVASCGDKPKEAYGWKVTAIRELSAHNSLG